MKKLCKLMSLVLSVIICLMFIYPASLNAANVNLKDSKILIIVNDVSIIDNSLFSTYEELFDVIDSSKIIYSDIKGYSAYAVQNQILNTNKRLCTALQKEYQRNSLIYVFGELTIHDYKRALGVDRFGVYTNVYNDKKEIIDNKAFLSFGEEQENTYIENIISSSGSQMGNYIIANVVSDNDKTPEQNYISIILNNYSKSRISTLATGVKSGYNYYSYYNADNFVLMEYLLYKNNDETDPDYDYFAIVTNVSAESNAFNVEQIYLEHRLPFESDEMIDYDPGDITRAYQISCSLSFGEEIGGSVGFSFDGGGGPTINATYSGSSDYCNWYIDKYWFNGSPLQNTLFKLGTSWASTGTYAGTDVKFRGKMYSSFLNITVYTSWKTVQIRYDYE